VPRFSCLPALAFAAALVVPAWASANPDRLIDFRGIVSTGSAGRVLIDTTFTEETTNFDGQPVDLSIVVSGDPGAYFVSSFTASWSNATYAFPFITHEAGDGFVIDPANDGLFGFYSTVDLNSLGGSISIFPTNGYIATTDGDFELTFNFTYSTAQDPFGNFTDNGLTGGGTFDDFKTFLIDPAIGPYDPESLGDFALTGVTQRVVGVPEPSAWALMLLGVASLGVALRARASRRVA
jgi:hypothetical protein